MVSRSFYEPSAELADQLERLRAGRVYTCPIETSPAFHRGLATRGQDHEVWSFAVMLETLSPAFNVPLRVPTALSPDLTMLVPTERILSPEEGACTPLAPLLQRLRDAGVSTVLSLDPLEDPALRPLFVLAPQRIRPVAVHAYALADPAPRVEPQAGGTGALRETANRLELDVASDAATTLLVRDAWAPGWSARVDGKPVALPRGRHRQLALPPGRHQVRFDSHRPAGSAPSRCRLWHSRARSACSSRAGGAARRPAASGRTGGSRRAARPRPGRPRARRQGSR